MKTITSKTKIKKPVSFWYAVKNAIQSNFEGQPTVVQVFVGEGHIVYNEVLMCGQSREALQKTYKADRAKQVELRIEGLPVCKKCQQKFKENSALSWQKWTKNIKEPA